MTRNPTDLAESVNATPPILGHDNVSQTQSDLMHSILERIQPIRDHYIDSTGQPDLTEMVHEQVVALVLAITHLSDGERSRAVVANFEKVQRGAERELDDRLNRARRRMTTLMRLTTQRRQALRDRRRSQLIQPPDGVALDLFSALLDTIGKTAENAFEEATKPRSAMRHFRSALRRGRGSLLTLQATKTAVAFLLLTIGFGWLQDRADDLGHLLGTSSHRNEWCLRPGQIEAYVYVVVAMGLFALDRWVLGPAIEKRAESREVTAQSRAFISYCVNRIHLEYLVAILEDQTDKAVKSAPIGL